MKMTLVPLVIALAAITTLSSLRAEDFQPIPDYGRVKEITLHGQAGLILRIFPNGSADLVYGPGQSNTTRLPRETFSFQDVYAALLPGLMKRDTLVDRDNQGKDVAYAAPEKAPFGTTYDYYLQDQNIINKLLADAGVRVIREDLKSAS